MRYDTRTNDYPSINLEVDVDTIIVWHFHEDLRMGERFWVELKLVGGTAAGTAWYLFEIVAAGCPDRIVPPANIVGKYLCIGDADLTYHSRREWDDGFVSNASIDADDLPYREGGEPDGSGTGMGGDIVLELDGLSIPEFDFTMRD